MLLFLHSKSITSFKKKGINLLVGKLRLNSPPLKLLRLLVQHKTLKIEHESSEQIQMAITFDSDIQLQPITYRDSRNLTQNLLANSNGHNFSHEGPIWAHNISWCSKLNKWSSWEIQMVITFNSNVRFRRITYRDARNWTTETLEKFKWS